MLTELDDDRCHTERVLYNGISNERLRIKIRYLEKDNKDLQLDLADVESTLQINKTIIDTLVDATLPPPEKTQNLLAAQQREIQILKNQVERLQSDRDQYKAELLIKDQLINNKQIHDEGQYSSYEIEIQRLVDNLEKKEYTLQLLEQRLFDCEKFLWDWGKKDNFIWEQL